MTFEHLDKIIFSSDSSLKDVLEKLNDSASYTQGGFGLVVDDENKCIGVITDGDIRRKLLIGISLDAPIINYINKDFKYVEKNYDSHMALRIFDSKITNIPVLDNNKEIIDLLQYNDFKASSRFSSKIIRARVPVRVSFSGGGTDMSDFINANPTSILSSTISKYCTCSVLVRADSKITIQSKDLDLFYSANSIDKILYGDDLDLVKAAIKIMQPKFGFDLEILAEFDSGTGLGGSSAIVVSVIGALNYFRNESQLDNYQIADLAYQVERIEMNRKGGWQDQYATCFGGFNWLEFKSDDILVTPLRLSSETTLELEYNLMLFRVGETRKSADIQEEHISDLKSNSELMKPKYLEMIDVSSQMRVALLKSNLKKFGDLLDKAWFIKKEIGSRVTNKEIDEYYKTAKEAGALGGKLLGAGSGGYLLIYSSPLYQKKIIGLLEEKGAIFEPFRFSQKGLEVWATMR